MILRSSDDQRLTLELAELGPKGTPGDDDVLLNVSVVVGGFSAADQFWVVGVDWREFMQQLRQLERTRRGQAKLVGASPEEFEIKFASVSGVGHMSVSGTAGRHTFDGFFQRLQFGFCFDPGMLGTVVGELGEFAQ